MKALLVAVALLAPAAPGEGWWNKDWKFRRPILINNRLDRPLDKGFTLTVEIDPDYLGVREKSRKGLEEWALVRGEDRIPFLLQPGSGKTLTLGFRLRVDIRAGASDLYELYYGNPEGTPLPATAEDAFEFFEDFSRPEALAERLRGSGFEPVLSAGTYFQLVDYGALSGEADMDFADRLIREAKIATIPLSPFYASPPPMTLLRLCIAKKDATLEAAAERLCAFAAVGTANR